MIHTAEMSYRNGAAELAVTIVKKALNSLDGVFTCGDFQTFLFMPANLENVRPIDARTYSKGDCGVYHP